MRIHLREVGRRMRCKLLLLLSIGCCCLAGVDCRLCFRQSASRRGLVGIRMVNSVIGTVWVEQAWDKLPFIIHHWNLWGLECQSGGTLETHQVVTQGCCGRSQCNCHFPKHWAGSHLVYFHFRVVVSGEDFFLCSEVDGISRPCWNWFSNHEGVIFGLFPICVLDPLPLLFPGRPLFPTGLLSFPGPLFSFIHRLGFSFLRACSFLITSSFFCMVCANPCVRFFFSFILRMVLLS